MGADFHEVGFVVRVDGKPQRLDHALRNFVLNLEDVAQFPVETLGPDVAAIVDIDQLGDDPQLVAGLANAALQQGLDAELASDLPGVAAHVAVLEG